MYSRAGRSSRTQVASNAETQFVFILWFGWFGFNGGSQLALASAVDVVAMSNVLVNTNLAAAAGAFVFGVSWLLWTVIEKTIGVRVTYNVEQLGQDAAELGIEAYPEFLLMPELDDDA